MLLPMSYLSPSSSLPTGFPTLCCFSSYPLSLSLCLVLPFYYGFVPPFIALRECGGHHFFPHSFTYSHVPQNPKGSLTNSEDSLGTCFKRQMVFRSGFLSESLILGDRPFRGLHTHSLCDPFRPPTSRQPLGCGRINPRYSASDWARYDGFWDYLP